VDVKLTTTSRLESSGAGSARRVIGKVPVRLIARVAFQSSSVCSWVWAHRWIDAARSVVDVAPDVHRRHPDRRNEALVECHAAQRSAHAHHGDGFACVADGRCDATESGQRLLPVEGHAVRAHLGELLSQLRGCGDRVPGPARREVDDVGPRRGRQHRLADGGALRGRASADPGGDRGDHPVADLLEVDDVGSVEHGEVHHKAGRAMQFV